MMETFRRRSSLLLVVGVLLVAIGCARPPALGENEDASKIVDAMMTAVYAKRVDMLDRSASRIVEMRDKGELSAETFDYLNATVENARGGDWAGAMDRLKFLVANQPERSTP